MTGSALVCDVAGLRTLQSLGRRHVRYSIRIKRRTGTPRKGRYRAAPVDSDAYFLDCCRYIELNLVRAGAVPGCKRKDSNLDAPKLL